VDMFVAKTLNVKKELCEEMTGNVYYGVGDVDHILLYSETCDL